MQNEIIKKIICEITKTSPVLYENFRQNDNPQITLKQAESIALEAARVALEMAAENAVVISTDYMMFEVKKDSITSVIEKLK